jgi:hypothetical protein
MTGFLLKWALAALIWAVAASVALGQGVPFSLDTEGAGSLIAGNPRAVYGSAPVSGFLQSAPRTTPEERGKPDAGPINVRERVS